MRPTVLANGAGTFIQMLRRWPNSYEATCLRMCTTRSSGSTQVCWRHLSQLATGCVTCHTSHGCVTHFRPILGNLVEVTLVTSPFMYIVSHAKGTSFP